MADPWCFRVEASIAGVVTGFKISLSEAWRRKPFDAAVVGPFVKSVNQKAAASADGPSSKLLAAESLERVLVDGTDLSIERATAPVASVLVAQPTCVHLVFGRLPLQTRQFFVRCAEVELKITLDAKWQKRTFRDAVVSPFLKSYNARAELPVTAAMLTAVRFDGEQTMVDAGQPVMRVLPEQLTTVELFFGAAPTAAEEQARFWRKVGLAPRMACGSPRADVRDQLRELHAIEWHHRRLFACDGGMIARLLGAAQPLRRCERIDLNSNELGCDGVAALAGALTQAAVPALTHLFLHHNRIADRGALALAHARLPRLRVLMLQHNEIGDAGLDAFGELLGVEDDERTFYAKSIQLMANRHTAEARGRLQEVCLQAFIDVAFHA